MKLKGFFGWNVFASVIAFIAIFMGGTASVALLMHEYSRIIGIAIGVGSLVFLTLFIIGNVKMNKIKKKFKSGQEVTKKDFGLITFLDFLMGLIIIGLGIGGVCWVIKSSFSNPLRMYDYLLLGGSILAVVLGILTLIFTTSPYFKFSKTAKGVKSELEVQPSSKSGDIKPATSPIPGTVYVDVPDVIPTGQITDSYNYYARPFTLPTNASLNKMTEEEFLCFIYKKFLMHRYSFASQLLAVLLCSDQTNIDVVTHDDRTVWLDIVYKGTRDGYLYLILDDEEQNALVVVRLVENKESQVHEPVFIANEEDPVYLDIISDYIRAEHGIMFDVVHKAIQVVKKVPTVFDERFAPIISGERNPASSKQGGYHKKKRHPVLHFIWSLIKFTIGWIFWIFTEIVLFIIDAIAHTEMAKNFMDGFLGRESSVIVEDEAGYQHKLTFHNGCWYDEDAHIWYKDGDTFYRG